MTMASVMQKQNAQQRRANVEHAKTDDNKNNSNNNDNNNNSSSSKNRPRRTRQSACERGRTRKTSVRFRTGRGLHRPTDTAQDGRGHGEHKNHQPDLLKP